LRIGIIHYSCPPLVGGVEEVVSQHAIILHRLGYAVSLMAGMGEIYTDLFPVRIEPLLGSKNKRVMNAHEQCHKGIFKNIQRFTNDIFQILEDWSQSLDVILAHNVLQMPFNLPLALALRRLAASGNQPAVVSWAHDSPYFYEGYPDHLNHHPWNNLRLLHSDIHYVTISESRKKRFENLTEGHPWTVIHDGIDPTSLFYFDPKTLILAREMNLFGRDLIVVQPSRITPRKNLELSMHIVRGIKRLGYNVLFMLTGAYDPHENKAVSYYRRLRYWIKELDLQDNIAILAEYKFKDGTKLVPDKIFIRDLYLIADLLLMTSKDEGFGLPILEAGIIKLPIACSAIPPFLELGEDVCFFNLNEPPLSIAGRIVEYLAHTNTHKMFRRVLIPYLDRIVENGATAFSNGGAGLRNNHPRPDR